MMWAKGDYSSSTLHRFTRCSCDLQCDAACDPMMLSLLVFVSYFSLPWNSACDCAAAPRCRDSYGDEWGDWGRAVDLRLGLELVPYRGSSVIQTGSKVLLICTPVVILTLISNARMLQDQSQLSNNTSKLNNFISHILTFRNCFY